MDAKKIVGLIFSIIFVGAFAFVLTWGITNFNKVQEGISGTGLYTQEDLNNAYQDGYDTALENKDEYDELINGYRDTITTLNDNISQLNSQVNDLKKNNKDYDNQVKNLEDIKKQNESTIAKLMENVDENANTIVSLNSQISQLQKQVVDLQATKDDNDIEINRLNNQIISLQTLTNRLQTTNDLNNSTINNLNNQIIGLNNQINELNEQMNGNNGQVIVLNNKIVELEKSVAYYQKYIDNLENGEQVVATFEFNGSVYNIQVLNRNSLVSVSTPESTDYVIFNGWTVGGQIIDLADYRITANTKFVADVTYRYDVKFIVDSNEYSSQIVTKNAFANVPTNPEKDGYEFDGWTIDGVNLVDVSRNEISANTIYTAVFTKVYSVVFMNDTEIVSSQSVRSGNYATIPSNPAKNGYEFDGWSFNGIDVVSASTNKIISDVTYLAVFTKIHTVNFVYEDEIIATESVRNEGYVKMPKIESTDYKVFNGWKLNNEIVNLTVYSIEQDLTLVADITYRYDVNFVVDGQTYFSQIITKNGVANIPSAPSISGYEFDGWTLDGNNLVNVSNTPITQNTTFVAKFTKLYTVKFSNNNGVQETQVIRAGEKIKSPSVAYSGYKINSWNLNGTAINFSSYTVNSDITLVPSLTKKTLAECSWTEISDISTSGQAKNFFKVGDTKSFTMTTGETITVAIMGFNHDDLSSGGKAGITFGMTHLMNVSTQINGSKTNVGSWRDCTFRNYTIPTYLGQLNSELASVIKSVNKKTSAGNKSSSIVSTSDKLWLFSEVEITGGTSVTFSGEGSQYEYWRTVKNGSNNSSQIMYHSNGTAGMWYLRSPRNNVATAYALIGAAGGLYGKVPTENAGICLGFCI